MTFCSAAEEQVQLAPEAVSFYQDAQLTLEGAGIPHLVGGAYALAKYTGVIRHTKDFDVFLLPKDRDKALLALAARGYDVHIEYSYWLAKAFKQDHFVDLIYRSPNGLAEVTPLWFERAVTADVFGMPARLCAPEEMLLNKMYILNNDRNDLADVMHLLHSCASTMDWNHLLMLFDKHWRLLLSHLVMFGFVYPSERGRIPREPFEHLLQRLQGELTEEPPSAKVCNGTLFSHSQYRIDVEQRGFHDGRLQPTGTMDKEQLRSALISTQDLANARSD